MKKQDKTVNIKNRRANFDYEFILESTAGIILQGSEVKALQGGLGSIGGSFCYFKNGELWLKNFEITHWRQLDKHDPSREKKLLLTKKQLRTLERELVPGKTIIVKKVHTLNGRIKVDIALARGKKDYDKRQSIKERDLKREMNRER